MTLLAQRCLIDAQGAAPADCRGYFHLVRELSGPRHSRSYDELQLAVRWPDDPARQVSSPGVADYLFNMTFGCKRRILRGLDRNGVVPRLDEAGLLCGSHFGRLQFLHAQTVPRDTEADTRAKILDWADLTFRIATGRVEPDSRICDHFRHHPSSLSVAFELDPSHCDPANPGALTFAMLFDGKCGTPASMRRCRPLQPGGSAAAVVTARGALLHLIQDSYSQSHVERGEPARPANRYVARVDCSLPSRFFDFLGQHGHGRADKVPVLADNCAAEDRRADDVITASAMALHHIEQRSHPDIFGCYLQDRVFGPRQARPGEPPPAPCPPRPATLPA